MPNPTVLPRRLPGPARRLPAPARAAILLLLGLVLSACATTEAPSDSALSGHWHLDSAASDNLNSMVTRAVDSAEQKLRARHGLGGARGRGAGRRGDGGSGGGSGGGPGGGAGPGGGDGDATITTADEFGNITAIGPDFRQLRERLLQTLQAPDMLVVNVQPDQVKIQHDGLPARDYQPGESLTRLDEYGTAVLQARWSGGAFELRERYTNGARLTERYEVGRDGTLTCTRSLADPTVGKLLVKSVYRRT
jgi:hypothetical protein